MIFKKRFFKKYRKKLQNFKDLYDDKIISEKQKVISILTHDIKTPILAQNQSLDLLLNGNFGNLMTPQKEILKEIKASNNFLLEIVLNMIFLEKYEKDRPKLNLENINISNQIEDCFEIIKNQAGQKSQNIVFRSNVQNTTRLLADKNLIRKIILNLLSSSINFGFENSIIEVMLEENKDSISFLTKNKSLYMTKEKLQNLFEQKGEKSDFNALGMSLNLNIAKKLINAHNWDIVARSNPDNSSVFGFVVKK